LFCNEEGMANAFFRLRKVKSKKPELIYLGFRFGKDQLIYSTGIKVLPKHWDFAKSRVKNVAEIVNKDEINSFLLNVSEFVNSVDSTYRIQRQVLTKDLLKHRLEEYFTPTPISGPNENDFFEFIDGFISDLESGVRLLKGEKLADPKTVQRYRTARESLKQFESELPDSIKFSSWTEAFYKKYIHFLTFTKKYKINNIGFYQKQLFIYLRAARKEKLLEADWIEEKSVATESPIDVYWTKDELAAMMSLELDSKPSLSKVRDLAIVGAYTGFRISDWVKVRPANFKITGKGNRYIEIIPEKENSTPPSTPLNPIVETIVSKYGGVLPTISQQKFNEYLKELCKLAGQTESIKIKFVREGRTVIEEVEKWSQVSSHTCRRSFATNEYLDGTPSNLIMKATGHTSEKNFLKYLKLDNSGSVDAMAQLRLERGRMNE